VLEYKSPLWKFFTRRREKAALVAELDVAGERHRLLRTQAPCDDALATSSAACAWRSPTCMQLHKDSTALQLPLGRGFPAARATTPRHGRWVAVHHPLHAPEHRRHPAHGAGEYAKVRAEAYDVVLNGYELGGGSIRIHESDLQAKMFGVLGVSLRSSSSSSATSSMPSASVRRRTAVSRSASTASPCSYRR